MDQLLFFGFLVLLALIVLWAVFDKIDRRKKRKEARDANENAVAFARLPFEQAEIIYNECIDELSEDSYYKVIDFVHDISDSNGKNLQTTYNQIEFEQAFDILRDMETVKGPVRIILHTFGGYSLASEMIASALKEHSRRNGVTVEAYIPYAAMSGGTMIALASGVIRMGANASLGPIDTQYYGFSAKLFKMLLDQKDVNSIDDQSFLIANESVLDWDFSIESAMALAHDAHVKDGADFIAKLAAGDLPHSKRILPKEADENGLIIKQDCPPAAYRMVDAKRQMMKDLPDLESHKALLARMTKNELWNFARPHIR